MDKTEMYVRMSDCEEVQGQWEPKIGDRTNIGVVVDAAKLVGAPWVLSLIEEGPFKKCECPSHQLKEIMEHLIWLPTQDRIQGMLGDQATTNGYVWTCLLMERRLNGKIPSNIAMLTWEKNWLCIYMHEKHNKTWDGEKWVKNP